MAGLETNHISVPKAFDMAAIKIKGDALRVDFVAAALSSAV
jgi:hypothetical protein